MAHLRSHRYTDQRQQSGVALITALLVVALATIAASAMVYSNFVAIHRTATFQQTEVAWWYADGIESWLLSLLQKDASTHPSVDSLGDAWAQPVVNLPLDEGAASGHLEDLQGRFNLNNLGTLNPQPYLDQFRRLVENVPGLDRAGIEDVGPAIRDWIDTDSDSFQSLGAEDDYYSRLVVPYRAANRLMMSPSELLAVKGVTPALYKALKPYITALPTTSAKVNLNTAPLPVLLSLSTTPAQGIDAFVREREHLSAKSVQEAVTRGVLPAGADAAQMADVRTDYFGLEAEIRIGNSQLTLYSMIFRPASGAARVIRHSIGTE